MKNKNTTQREILTSEEFKTLLKERGLKVTTQRLAVLDTLGINPDAHLTVEEIYDLVKKSNPEIGLATIYRTVQVLKELQLIDRVNFDDGIERYELVHLSKDGSHKHHHHHLICVNCGRVFEFEEDMMENLELKIAKKTGFKVIDHEVKLYGYCKECGGKPIE
ncbi:Fur family transcriptional regulator [Butyrivibrio sp. WCD3002]|uniref:Fur family transcriptional regulator n=1 Tax=Butyrivibrio sp. WCD3002 TaxID=1280676 RepID=UPI00041E768E|nr:Fur family transcriptional regulator [Butyrivibrio sp. WCD3002]